MPRGLGCSECATHEVSSRSSDRIAAVSLIAEASAMGPVAEMFADIKPDQDH